MKDISTSGQGRGTVVKQTMRLGMRRDGIPAVWRHCYRLQRDWTHAECQDVNAFAAHAIASRIRVASSQHPSVQSPSVGNLSAYATGDYASLQRMNESFVPRVHSLVLLFR